MCRRRSARTIGAEHWRVEDRSLAFQPRLVRANLFLRLSYQFGLLSKEAAVLDRVELKPQLVGIARYFALNLAVSVPDQWSKSRQRRDHDSTAVAPTVLEFDGLGGYVKSCDTTRDCRQAARQIHGTVRNPQISTETVLQIGLTFGSGTVDRHRTQPQCVPRLDE